MMPKCTGSMPNVLMIGQEDRRADQQHRRQIHERAEEQQQQVHVEQEHVLVAGDGDEELGGPGRDAHQRHHVAERHREADHDHHHADGAHHAADQQRQVGPFVVAVDEHGDEEGVDAGDCRRLGRGEDAGQDAAQDDDHGHQAPDRLVGDAHRLAQPDRLALWEVLAMGDDEAQDHQRQPEQQTRDDAGHEQVRHRHGAAGGQRIDHRVVRGRDQQGLQRARDRHVDREQARIAVLDHLRDHHGADRGGIGDGGARDGAEHGRGQDVDQRQAAANEADEHLGQVDDPLRHAAFGHDGAGQDEERDRQQRKIVHAVGRLDHDGFERQVDPQRREDG